MAADGQTQRPPPDDVCAIFFGKVAGALLLLYSFKFALNQVRVKKSELA